jgi:hypothetical protein
MVWTILTSRGVGNQFFINQIIAQNLTAVPEALLGPPGQFVFDAFGGEVCSRSSSAKIRVILRAARPNWGKDCRSSHQGK